MTDVQVENLYVDNSLVPKLSGHIHFYKRGDSEYAIYEKDSYIRNGTTHHHSVYLGRVINKENSLYFSNKFGFFNFTLENGLIRRYDMVKDTHPESLHLRYGDIWLYEEILSKTGFNQVTSNLIPYYNDTLNALLAFRLSDDSAYCNAQQWFERSYAKVLYPRATMSSASISSFLEKLGDEINYRQLTSLYLNFLTKGNEYSPEMEFPILIDSTGIHNSINVDKIQISNHSGVINNEIRLIYVVDRDSGLPIYFKPIAGNIIDNSTLKTTLSLLKDNNINVKFMIMDAGYSSLANLDYLCSLNINFVTLMNENLKIYKSIIADNSHNLLFDIKSVVKYNERSLYCKQINIQIEGKQYYAYLCIDIDRFYIDLKSTFKKYSIGEFENDEQSIDYDNNINIVQDKFDNFGRFVLISNSNISVKEIVSTYYTRQRIEQIFDISKNNACLLPLRCHSNETIRGHLFITFLVTVISLLVNKRLEDTKLCSSGVFNAMRGLYINLFDNTGIIDEPTASENDVIEALQLKSTFIMDKHKVNNPKLKAIGSKRKRGRPKGRVGREINYRQVDSITSSMDTNNEDLSGIHSSDNSELQVKRSRGRPKGSKKNNEKLAPGDILQVKRSREGVSEGNSQK
jgi:transposase